MGLKVGVVGTGRLGREHVRVFSRLDEVDFVGCYDVRESSAAGVASEHGATAYGRLDDMIDEVDEDNNDVTFYIDVSEKESEQEQHESFEWILAFMGGMMMTVVALTSRWGTSSGSTPPSRRPALTFRNPFS